MTDPEQPVAPPLQVPPDVEDLIRQIIAKKFKLPPEEIQPDVNLATLHKEGFIRAAGAIPDVGQKLGLNLDIEIQEYAQALDERTKGVIKPDLLHKLRRLVPDIDSHPDNRQDYVMSVGLIGRLCASALERRQSSMSTWNEATRKLMLGHYVATAPIADQEWSASLPKEMGPGLYRLYLTGMLRAAFVRTGTLMPDIIEILEVAEKYAETAKNASVLDKKFRSVNTWKMRLNHLFPALLCVLKPECTAADGGELFFRIARAFDWNQAQTIAAAREWHRSLISPLSDESQFAAEWRTPEVVEQAQRMHDTREFGEFEKLGTRLMQAGCTSEEVLKHCIDPQRRHLRGDWLITLILGTVIRQRHTASPPVRLL